MANKNNKGNVWDALRPELEKEGYTDTEIHNACRYVNDYNSKYIENSKTGKYAPLSSNAGVQSNTLENLNQSITDERFTELLESTNDAIPLLSKYKLKDNQRAKLSLTERKQYWEIRLRLIAQKDEEVKIAKNSSKIDLITDGIVTEEEEIQESTVELDSALWSKTSLSYKIHDSLGDYFVLLAKANYDVRDSIEKFTPTVEIQEEHLQAWLGFRDRVIVPVANLVSFLMKFHKTMMDNVTDEKYGDTFLNWLKIAEDKFWSAGNHGSGEINSILTGKYIGKLKTNQYEIDEALELGETPPPLRYTVVETPIEREYTREQVGDETKFNFNETSSLHCSECGAENYYKVVPIQISDSVFGDWFNKAKMATVGNELSDMLEIVCDHVAIRKLRSPEDILRYYKPNCTPEEISKLGYIFGQPENMKAVDIDSKTIMSLGYNIIYGRAGRRANKAQHFSDNA